MLLIATDEAGYGPKLGPLVIAATAWKMAGNGMAHDSINDLFAPMRERSNIGALKIKVDDSKAVYQPGGGLAALHAVVSASHHWCGRTETTLGKILKAIAPNDAKAILSTPWLKKLSNERFLNQDETVALISAWRSLAMELIDVRARFITAAKFNASMAVGYNKADLLSESTLGLAAALVAKHANDESEVVIYCDRHGGRRYYTGVLGHTFTDAKIQVIAESKHRSAYRLLVDGKTIDIAFTVKGDSFTPVALSSMHAKYWRERLMEAFNAYFASLHQSDLPLKPTAGYPVDADRFLAEVNSTIQQHGIAKSDLIRSR